jgi:hypothetical protein
MCVLVAIWVRAGGRDEGGLEMGKREREGLCIFAPLRVGLLGARLFHLFRIVLGGVVGSVCLMFWSETCAVFRKGWLEEDGCGR